MKRLSQSTPSPRCPIITGTNRDEMKLFFSGYDSISPRKRLAVLLVAQDEAFYDAISEYFSRLWRTSAPSTTRLRP